MRIELITPEGSAFSGEAVSVTLPTGSGEITVLKDHIPLVSTIESGPVIVRTAEGDKYFAVSHGVVLVQQTGVRILTDIADPAEALVDREAEIEMAKKRAEELKAARRDDNEAFAEASTILEREIARLGSLRRYRSRRRSV